MNKSTPEYIRVREEIAKMFCGYSLKDSFDGDCVTEQDREVFRKYADRILSIKGVAIIADDQSLPDIDCFKGQVKRILIQANFKRVVE